MFKMKMFDIILTFFVPNISQKGFVDLQNHLPIVQFPLLSPRREHDVCNYMYMYIQVKYV